MFFWLAICDIAGEFITNLFIHFHYALHELGNTDASFRTTNQGRSGYFIITTTTKKDEQVDFNILLICLFRV